MDDYIDIENPGKKQKIGPNAKSKLIKEYRKQLQDVSKGVCIVISLSKKKYVIRSLSYDWK